MSDTVSLPVQGGRRGAELRDVETRETDEGGQKICYGKETLNDTSNNCQKLRQRMRPWRIKQKAVDT